MNSRYHPDINAGIENFLKKYKSFRGVYNELTWIKSTDGQAVQRMKDFPCWVQSQNYKTFVVLNESRLLSPDLKPFLPWIICHEILHVMKSHSYRFSEQPEVKAVMFKIKMAKSQSEEHILNKEWQELMMMWNMAADMAINGMFPLHEMPQSALLPRFINKFPGESAEEYFRVILEKRQTEKEDQNDKKEEGAKNGSRNSGDATTPGTSSDPSDTSKDSQPKKTSDEGEGSKILSVNTPDTGKPSPKPHSHQCGDNTEPPTGENSGEPGDTSHGAEAGEFDKSSVKKCTCGQYSRNDPKYKPCVHDVSLTPMPDNSGDSKSIKVNNPEESPDDECDPGELLRQVLAEGYKNVINDKKRGIFKNIDPNNFREAITATQDHSYNQVEKSLLRDFTEVAPYNWEALLRNFFKTGSKMSVKFTRKKRDRRFGTRPGIQIVPKKHVAFVIDTSFSMDTQKIMSAKPILDSLAKQMDVTIIHCDYRVNLCQKWKPRDFLELRGGGGTLATPAIRMCQKLRVDGMVYYTDGMFHGSDHLSAFKKPKFDVIWLLVDAKHLGLNRVASRLPDWGKRVIVD